MSDTSSVSAFYNTFRDIIRLIHACTRVEDIAQAVVVEIARAFKAPGGVLELYQRSSGQSVIKVVHGLGEVYREAGPFAGAAEVLAACAGKKVVVIEAAGRDKRLVTPEPAVKMLVAAPLELQEGVAGFLGLVFDHARDLAAGEREFLATVAQQCTCALDKARLIEQQQWQFDQLAHQTERLTALGRMAAGVAHELNNPLSGILLYSSNMLKKVAPGDFLHEGLGIIIQETKRCKTIIQELQEFSRSKEPKKIVGSINKVLEKVCHLLESEFRRRSIRLHLHLAEDLPHLLIDIGQMQQVFANLLINAMEAVSGKGQVAVTTRWEPARQVIIIEVADTGCGIPPEHLERIHKPFFSTKPQGTGLGLAVSHGFIMNHQGELQVESQPGKGTRVSITIPMTGVELERKIP